MWHLALALAIIAIEVPQCPLRSGSRSWRPAVPTELWRSPFRSGSAHWDLELGARGWDPAVPTEIWFWEEAGGRRRNEEIMIRSRGLKTSQNASRKVRPRHIIIWLGVSLVAALVKRFGGFGTLVSSWLCREIRKESINEGIFQGKENMVVLHGFTIFYPSNPPGTWWFSPSTVGIWWENPWTKWRFMGKASSNDYLTKKGLTTRGYSNTLSRKDLIWQWNSWWNTFVCLPFTNDFGLWPRKIRICHHYRNVGVSNVM